MKTTKTFKGQTAGGLLKTVKIWNHNISVTDRDGKRYICFRRDGNLIIRDENKIHARLVLSVAASVKVRRLEWSQCRL